MDEHVRKYLCDMIDSINEIEVASERFGKSYSIFDNDVVYRKFVERNIEIIGEAMNRILKIDPTISITSSRKIVDTRNYVIHAYDSLKSDILWAIVINHLPRLKEEIISIINA
ncbi:MAG: DUF86 domain-containing protein [Duncaniella sp.]|nr:DUF86 domain-containing protein [Duncaniella sp.]